MDKKLRYEMNNDQANTLLEIVNRSQFSGVNGAKIVLELVNLLQTPINAEELEKETFEALKEKFEKKETK